MVQHCFLSIRQSLLKLVTAIRRLPNLKVDREFDSFFTTELKHCQVNGLTDANQVNVGPIDLHLRNIAQGNIATNLTVLRYSQYLHSAYRIVLNNLFSISTFENLRERMKMTNLPQIEMNLF
jgi:hypothetical protein